jgi:hypothetical protein
VDAETYEQVEKMRVYFIPLLTQRETCVRCRNCGTIQLARLPLRDLATLSADELKPWLYERVSIIAKFIALASLLLICMPFVSLVLGIIGLAMNFRSGGWPKSFSIAAIALNAPVTLFCVYALLAQPVR